MKSPFKIEGPAVISFSGGRTSGRMLWEILQAHGGRLPADVLTCFCNTGRERVETLDFIERCSGEWGVNIVWLEYRRDDSGPIVIKGRNGQPAIGRHGFAVVNYATASRKAEPFDQLLSVMAEFRREAKSADELLPNPVQRFCTGEMKVRTLGRYLSSLGWDLEDVTDAIGLRADEPSRVAKLRARASSKTMVWECGNPVAPLADAKMTEADVMSFWSQQSFDLQLRQHEGNCDLCFLKSAGKIQRIIRGRPDLAQWWIDAEKRTGQRFRDDRASYKSQLRMAQDPQLPGMGDAEDDEEAIDCHCTN